MQNKIKVNFKIKLIRKYKLNFIDFILQLYFPVGSLSRGVNSNQVWGEGGGSGRGHKNAQNFGK